MIRTTSALNVVGLLCDHKVSTCTHPAFTPSLTQVLPFPTHTLCPLTLPFSHTTSNYSSVILTHQKLTNSPTSTHSRPLAHCNTQMAHPHSETSFATHTFSLTDTQDIFSTAGRFKSKWWLKSGPACVRMSRSLYATELLLQAKWSAKENMSMSNRSIAENHRSLGHHVHHLLANHSRSLKTNKTCIPHISFPLQRCITAQPGATIHPSDCTKGSRHWQSYIGASWTENNCVLYI